MRGVDTVFEVAWQRKLDVGDHFCILCVAGVVIYGVVLPPREREPLAVDERWTRTYSETHPQGSDGYLRLSDVDLPLTRAQFLLAKRLGWPSVGIAIRVVLRIQPMARG